MEIITFQHELFLKAESSDYNPVLIKINSIQAIEFGTYIKIFLSKNIIKIQGSMIDYENTWCEHDERRSHPL